MSNYIFTGNLRPEFSTGMHYRDRMTLYRADKLLILEQALEVGILSTAFATGNAQSVWNFAGLCTSNSTTEAVEATRIIDGHTTLASQRQGLHTPFISATPFLGFARKFAKNSDEGIVEFRASIGNLVVPPNMNREKGLTMEILVLGMVSPQDIVGLVE